MFHATYAFSDTSRAIGNGMTPLFQHCMSCSSSFREQYYKSMLEPIHADRKFFNHHAAYLDILLHTMPSAHRYGTTHTARARPNKQFPQIRKTVKLSAQVRKVLTTEQQAKRAAFDADVAVVWRDNLKACEELSAKHHKTLQKCQDAIFLGAKMMSGTHKKISKWKAYISVTVKKINESKCCVSVNSAVADGAIG